MTYRWREHEAAHTELREAVLFLEDEREGWGDKFADAVEAAINSILVSPHSWGLHRGGPRELPVRTKSIAGFRYDIKYMSATKKLSLWRMRMSVAGPATGRVA